MGTESQVKEHEPKCVENYDRRSCFTCKHKSYKSLKQYKCAQDIEIPENKIWEFCPKYEIDERGTDRDLKNVFGGLFGGI